MILGLFLLAQVTLSQWTSCGRDGDITLWNCRTETHPADLWFPPQPTPVGGCSQTPSANVICQCPPTPTR